MIRKSIIFFICFVSLILSFSQIEEPARNAYLKEYREADKIYREAEALSQRPDYNSRTEEQEKKMNHRALEQFREVLSLAEKNHDDSIAFHCYYKIGVLEHYFDNVEAARKAYRKAIDLKEHLPRLPDSFLFKTHLYAGIIDYQMNFFDSALHNYKTAERIASIYPKPLSESQRLYNTLGVLYYETGNYRQAKNYFEKALSVLTPATPFYQALSVNYRNNLASVFIRLEEYDKADSIYKSLLAYNITKDEILHNLGSINLTLGAFKKALQYFRQVQYSSSKKVRLLNDMGLAFAGMKEFDSAAHYFQLALEENRKWNAGLKNTAHGLTLKYLGDLHAEQNRLMQSAALYQQAIIQFAVPFNDSSLFHNPEQFSGIFSYIHLFSTLTAKAEVLEKIYSRENQLAFLQAALDAYRSAFRLADYVEKTYDSDEARIFLNRIKYSEHDKPIQISLSLYEKTGDTRFLEEAYRFDQQNKASILLLNIKESEIRSATNALSDLFREEAAIKSAITRLTLKVNQLTDSLQQKQISESIRDYEIRLSRLHERMNEDPAYRLKKSPDRIPPVNEVRRLLDNTSAVLSYHLAESELLILLISRQHFDYARVQLNDTFFRRIDTLKNLLHRVQPDERYTGQPVAAWLYQKLIAPVIKKLNRIEHLIIIPDDELHYLPFEALVDEGKKYLLERFSVQYQFSAALLAAEVSPPKKNGLLAFAPFSEKAFEHPVFTLLPSSADEVKGLKGKIFTDSTATKKNFLLYARNFPVIHLATHAVINHSNPMLSYIAFYPGDKKDPQDFLLYAGEIYNLQLDSTDLIILSACETGSGSLVKGEGLMSLSRAFAYTGCPNIITSLWKAEDQTTSFLTQRLHHYLGQNLRKHKALQLAKLDLLNNNRIEYRFKSPAFWSHLIYIGPYSPARSSSNWWWFAATIVILGALVYLAGKLKRN
jgi:CHAT domain-containing protein/Tfp pilus assembly protein PilF